MARKFLTPINLTGLELTNFKIQNLPDNPSAYGAGHTYYNTAHKEIRVYDGTQWVAVGGSVEFGNYSAIPSAGNAGRIYAATDTGVLYLDNGSSWVQIGIGAATSDTLSNKTISGTNNTLSNIDNGSLVHSSVTINGVTFNLGDTNTIKASTTNALTIGTGLTGTSFDGSSAVTVAIDSTVVTTTGSQTLSNKTLGSNNSLGANLAAGGYKVTGLGTPTDAADAATKGYVDATAQGLYVLGSVVAASDVNVPSLSAVTTVGGVTLQNGARVLLKNQDTATQNGIYIYNSSTTTLAPSTNVEDTALKEGSYVLVTEGTHAAQGWIITSYSGGASTWTQFSAAGEYTAGNGINISGTTISAVAGDGISVSGGSIAVDNTVVRKYSATITGNASLTSFSVTHNLGTTDVQVSVYDTTGNELVITDVYATNSNAVSVGFAVAPASGKTYRVVVHA